MSITAYKRTLREVESPRQIERRLLATITGRLDAMANRFDQTEDRHLRLELLSSGLRETLVENQKLWSAMKYDLSDPGNALPADLRATLLSLALWVEKTTAAVLGGQAGVRALTDVNHNIVAALTGQALAESA
ncbi:flaF protein [Aquicoccus sp. SCR17]|nr:flaF protein [Carideicomes alvinocaridis]